MQSIILQVKHTVFSGPTTSYAFTRLELLSAKFNLHILLNGTRELNASKSVPHRDFYNVRKVDTHVHHSVRTLTLVLYISIAYIIELTSIFDIHNSIYKLLICNTAHFYSLFCTSIFRTYMSYVLLRIVTYCYRRV